MIVCQTTLGNILYDIDYYSSPGTDATGAFQDVGHSTDAIQTREKYLIGVVSNESSTSTQTPQTSTCCGGRCRCDR